jgi:hypothetical protein
MLSKVSSAIQLGLEFSTAASCQVFSSYSSNSNSHRLALRAAPRSFGPGSYDIVAYESMPMVQSPLAPQVLSTAAQSGIPRTASGRGQRETKGPQVFVEACQKPPNHPQRESVHPRIAGSSVAYLAVEPVLSFPRNPCSALLRTGAKWVASRDSPPLKAVGDDFAVKIGLVACFPKLTSSLRETGPPFLAVLGPSASGFFVPSQID